MRSVLVYQGQVEMREVVEYDALGINPNGNFCFIRMSQQPTPGQEWTPIEGALLFSVPFESVKRIEVLQ